jgi:hypothetical protein
VKYCKDFGTECHLDESCLREGRHIKEVESDGAQCVYVSTTVASTCLSVTNLV